MEPVHPTDNVSLFLSISNTTDREDALLFLEHSHQNLEVPSLSQKSPNFFFLESIGAIFRERPQILQNSPNFPSEAP